MIHFNLNISSAVWAIVILILGSIGLRVYREDTVRRYEIIERREQFQCPPAVTHKEVKRAGKTKGKVSRLPTIDRIPIEKTGVPGKPDTAGEMRKLLQPSADQGSAGSQGPGTDSD